MTNPIIIDWTESVYTPSGDFVESISCSEMFFSQSEADNFVKSLDTNVCDNISQS